MEAPARHAAADSLLERERELDALTRLIVAAQDGAGSIALIEGPAGIGKTRLLAEARERASDGMTVLTARCSQLERDFSFGAVRQLFEGIARDAGARERLLAGAGAPAGGVLDAPESDAAAEGSFAVLHGLYWAALNLAEERPVMLAIDDLQWTDRPSLRFIAYLAHRLEGVPILVAATVRSTDPGTDPTLLADIGADPLCESVRPGPLSDGSVAELIRARLADDVDPRFVAACHEATGGNPLLVRQLLTALEDDGVPPTAAGAAAVREIGPRAVSRSVLLRLSRLPENAAAVARAVAVLGQSSQVRAVAALTGLDDAAVAGAAGDLARADILRPDPPLGFVHPLVRDAVYGDLPPVERELQHGTAAAILAAGHASDEEVAAHLLHAGPRGAPHAVERLRGAARQAIRRGGPDSAIAYLVRALEEPPAADVRGQVLLEVGLAESEMSAPAAAEHLQQAYDELTDPGTRAAAGFALSHSLIFTGRPREGGELAHRTAAELPPELAQERAALETVEYISVFFGGQDSSALRRLEEFRDRGDFSGLGGKMLAAAAAFALAAGGGPAAECERLALASVEGGGLLEGGGGLAWSGAMVALILSDSARTPTFLDAARDEAYRRGSVFALSSLELWTGLYLLAVDLDEAGESLRHARQLQEPWGSDATGSSWARGLLGLYLFMHGDAAAAREALGAPVAHDDESDGANLWRRTHAELLLSEGKAAEALEVAELMAESAPWVRHPDWKPAGSLAARALAQLGRRDEALAAMQGELELARGTGARATVGRCLRQLGELEGDGGIDRLREAVDILSASPARLEYARALGALGGALRRAGRPTDAREPLRKALELAEACGCPPLVDEVRSDLHAAGARPRSSALAGVESLTARELRVASLAAEGRTNREIAQTLFVTPKTVEVHLSNAYRKLDVRSRRELPSALAAS